MLIYFFEPFYSGSHKAWIEGYQKSTKYELRVFSLKGKNWKWRMHGGAITLSKMINNDTKPPDLIIASDMMDLCTFKSLIPKEWINVPIVLYFHENQLSYPWNKDDKDLKLNRERHYGFINYTSALAADHCFFNSQYHMNSFLHDLKAFLKVYPDHRNMNTIEEISEKSKVLYLGLELKRFEKYNKDVKINDKPVFLWNHRWDYDKNPEAFIEVFKILNDKGFDFELIIAGEEYNYAKESFKQLKMNLGKKIIHFGFVDSFEDYARLLYKADYLPVTSNQDFFGISIAEAMYCKCKAILPERLTYRELFSNGSVFYKDENDLLKIIIRLIKEWPSEITPTNNSFYNNLDWHIMAKQYDHTFDTVISK